MSLLLLLLATSNAWADLACFVVELAGQYQKRLHTLKGLATSV
jgi:hypothetical protein